jgi:hypothetical protein
MRFTILTLLLLSVSFCWAAPIITNSAYGSSDPGVIGNWLNYDIQSASLSVSGATAALTLLFNYGFASGANWRTLGQFTDVGLSLNVGDVFFYDPSSPQNYNTAVYGIDLAGHDGLAPGNLYSLAGSNGTLTAQTVLAAANPSANLNDYEFRNNTAVWINPAASPTDVDSGSVSISAVNGASGPTASDPLLQVIVTFSIAGVSLFSDANIGFQFESATCANGILQGDFSNYGSDKTPEPSSLALALGGLLLTGIGLIRRKRSV